MGHHGTSRLEKPLRLPWGLWGLFLVLLISKKQPKETVPGWSAQLLVSVCSRSTCVLPAALRASGITPLFFTSLKESASPVILVLALCTQICSQLSTGMCLLTSGRALGFRECFSATYFLVAVITGLDHIWKSFNKPLKGVLVSAALNHPRAPGIRHSRFRGSSPSCFGQGRFKGRWSERKGVHPFWQGFSVGLLKD